LQGYKTSMKNLKDSGHTKMSKVQIESIITGLGLKKPDESPLKSAKTVDEVIQILDTNYAPGDNLAISPGGGGPRK